MSDAAVLASRDQVIESARTRLEELIGVISSGGPEAACTLGIYARSTRPNSSNVRKLEADVELAARMKQMVFRRLAAAPGWLEDGLLEPYDQRGTQESDVRCMVVSDAPIVERWFAGLHAPDAWPSFRKVEWQHKQISGVFVRIDFSGHSEPLICFAKWSDSLLLKRRGILAALSETRYSIQELDGEIFLPETIHFVFYRGCVFALDWKQFESALSFKEMTKARATELWADLLVDLPIANSSALWAKLSKSVRHQNTIIKALGRRGAVIPSMARVSQLIADNNLPISILNGELVVNPSDPAQIEVLTIIMANGYVTSDLTDTKLKTFDAEPR